MKKVEYEVTEKAGQFVAGMRSPGTGAPIMLTEEQAHYAVIAGELRLPPEVSKEEPPSSGSTKARTRRKSESKA